MRCVEHTGGVAVEDLVFPNENLCVVLQLILERTTIKCCTGTRTAQVRTMDLNRCANGKELNSTDLR